MAHPLSLGYLTLPIAPPRMIEAAAKAGFAGVGLRLLPAAPPQEAEPPILQDPVVLRETLAALRDTGLRCADIEVVRLNESFAEAPFEAFLDRGAALGAAHILVAGDDREEARLTDSYGRFCALAADYGLSCDLEPMPWSAVPNIAVARRILEAVGQPNAGILADALHWDRAKTSAAELADLSPAWMHYAQICDATSPYDPSDEGMLALARRGRKMPGEGHIDLIGFVQALPDSCLLSVEVPNSTPERSPEAIAQHAYDSTQAVLAAAGR